MGKVLYVAIAVLSLTLELVLTGPALTQHRLVKREEKERPEFVEEAVEILNDEWEKLWSGKCVGNDGCQPVISYCHQDESVSRFGECRMTWWFILILAIVVVMIISSIISCICCPCCCLFNACQKYCCCCCHRGYSQARS